MSDRLERLLNLVIALRETRRPLTAEDVRERVAGYGGRDHEAFRRMFERDKADLRALGIPVETAPTDRWRDREGYRIDPAAYDLPAVSLEGDELAALTLAVRAAGLDDEVGGGLRKLAVDAGRPGEAQPDPAVSVPLSDPRRPALVKAQIERRAVRFQYRPPGRDPQPRTVDPWGLVHRGGRWYLVGLDHDRGARRTFRLDRIDGEVATCSPAGAFDPVPVHVDHAVPDERPVTADIAAEPDIAWRVARRARGTGVPGAADRTLYRVRSRDPGELVGWVLQLGPGVEVLGPPALRAQVVQALDALVAQHGARGHGAAVRASGTKAGDR